MAEIQNPQLFTHLSAISTIDGRFRGKIESLSHYFSEAAVYKNRVIIEIEWLVCLSRDKIIRKFTQAERKILQDIVDTFSEKSAKTIWETDLQINHDTKAIELFIAEKLKKTSLKDVINYVHFGLTSTDVDNLAFALSFRDFLNEYFYKQSKIFLTRLVDLAKLHKNTVMLARTHGVPALPTTAGKELINFAIDMKEQLVFLQSIKISAKVSGAVGNRNELNVAFPEVNWEKVTNEFIESFGFVPQSHTTQVESHTNQANLFAALAQCCRIGSKLAQDLWLYNSVGYLAWRDNKGHVGSSVMPHKINPIGAELANTYFATAVDTFQSVINITTQNRLQRDLRDKYALRKIGEACSEMCLALDGLTTALTQIGFNEERLQTELLNHWEILSAPIQTILRVAGVENPYNMLKNATRGNIWGEKEYEEMLLSLPIAVSLKKKLSKLSPLTYTGEATQLTQKGIKIIEKYLTKH